MIKVVTKKSKKQSSDSHKLVRIKFRKSAVVLKQKKTMKEDDNKL